MTSVGLDGAAVVGAPGAVVAVPAASLEVGVDMEADVLDVLAGVDSPQPTDAANREKTKKVTKANVTNPLGFILDLPPSSVHTSGCFNALPSPGDFDQPRGPQLLAREASDTGRER